MIPLVQRFPKGPRGSGASSSVNSSSMQRDVDVHRGPLDGPNNDDAGEDDVTTSLDAAHAELDAIHKQVDQARSLLSDAIERLSQSFAGLDAEAASQKRMLEAVLSTMSLNEGTGDGRQRVSVRAFASETAAAFRLFTELLSNVSKQSVRTVYRIDDMSGQLDQVFKLVANINEISQETFVLAINATIAAAHAGPAGRSFSVIADNVRELSKRTRRFNDEIGSQISSARTAVDDVRKIISEMASRDLNVALEGKERVDAMMGGLQSFEQVIEETFERTKAASGRITDCTAQAVMGLQFEDILSQLLGSMDRHATRAGAALDGELQPGSSGGERTAFGGRGPSGDAVQQRDLAGGDVELF